MSKTLHVTDRNPQLFLSALVDQIKAGYYVTDTIEGIPTFDLLYEVQLTRTDKPSQREDLTNVDLYPIAEYSEIVFLLAIQDAVLQGFEIDLDSLVTDLPYGAYMVTLRRPVVVEPKEEDTKIERKAAGRPRTKKD